jgi:hypothetical protein
LFEQNDEAKCRQSAKSTIEGKAKVISYKAIEIVQAKRALMEAAKAGAAAKGKRDRKRKSLVQEAAKARKAQSSEVQVAKD